MEVRIAHAIRNEKGTYTGGKKGDQTGKEILVEDYYPHPKGQVLIRPIDPKAADIVARTAEAIAKNKNFGYGQGTDYRNSGFYELKKVDFKPEKVNVPCGLDCSKLSMASLYAAGIETLNFYTHNAEEKIGKTGKVKILKDKIHSNGSKHIKRGDLINTRTGVSGHIRVALTDGSAENSDFDKSKVAKAKSNSKSLSGTYKATSNLNLRYGAGTSKGKILTIPKGEEVKCYGNYTMVSKSKWVLVQYGEYTGFCSKKYLKKLK